MSTRRRQPFVGKAQNQKQKPEQKPEPNSPPVQCQPFVGDAVWKAFYEFEGLMIVWKDADIPLHSKTEYRDEATKGLERCAQEIRKRFSELLVM